MKKWKSIVDGGKQIRRLLKTFLKEEDYTESSEKYIGYLRSKGGEGR